MTPSQRAALDHIRNAESSLGRIATLCDIAETRVDGEFSLVYLVFNTIGNLTTQDAQVACFENASAHLRSGGRFVIEVGVPSLQLLPVARPSSRSTPARTGSASTSTTS